MREVGVPAGYVSSDEAVRVDVVLYPVTMEWKGSTAGAKIRAFFKIVKEK